MDALTAALEVIFADPNLGEDALWRPGGLGGTQVRVIRRQPSGMAEFGSSRAIMPAVLIEVRRAEAPDIAEGDLLDIGSQTFRVIAAPSRNSLGLVLTCEAAEA
ncbi:MAG: head-tail joining protein [Pseudomonadota bacterium]